MTRGTSKRHQLGGPRAPSKAAAVSPPPVPVPVCVGPGVGLGTLQRPYQVDFDTCDYPFENILDKLSDERPGYRWDLDPDYQRGHDWKEDRRRRFLGHFLVVGRMPLVFLNYGARSLRMSKAPEVLDGKQRLTSIAMFLRGEISARLPDDDDDRHPLWWRDFDEQDRRAAPEIKVGRLFLPTRVETLRFYLTINEPLAHEPEELDRVRGLLRAAQEASRAQ